MSLRLRTLYDIGCSDRMIVRRNDGVERFDNTLDALGILYKNVPALRPRIEELVNRTNKVRGAEDPNHKDHVDISNYGAERALKANMNRAYKAQGKKVEEPKKDEPQM